ncbi:YezD family protein [Brevibacillus sp. 179-C9.3 HS]|uniref:YezD family protein n=1 Tax=unclassified Brevibacillus TaxID=2684853 RepID=UPI0039A37892
MAKKEISLDELLLEKIARALDGLEYGSIHIVVHDSQVVQIERTEKYRIPTDKQEAKLHQARTEK